MCDTFLPQLNDKQRQAYNEICKGSNVLLTGSAGTGKSYLVTLVYHNINDKYKALTSTTGVSAVLLGGSTLHSYLGLGLGRSPVDKLVIKIRSKACYSKRWSRLEMLIIDEISMLSPVLFDKIEHLARIVRGNNKPFGGIQLILSGDFLQLPVVKEQNFCFEAESWNKCVDKIFNFTDIIRQGDKEFRESLNEVRMAKLSEKTIDIFKSCVGKDLTNDKGIIPTRIYSLNRSVDNINKKEVKKIKEEFYNYEMDIEVNNKINKKIREYKIDNFKKHSKLEETLYLCKGAQVMLTYNLDIDKGLANGSRGVVVNFISEVPEVLFMNGEKRIIDYKDRDIMNDNDWVATVYQIPLKLAYACTIHSSQGMEIDLAEISMKNIFEYGQAYVALSRVKSLQGLKLLDFSPKKIMAHPKALEFYEKLESE